MLSDVDGETPIRRLRPGAEDVVWLDVSSDPAIEQTIKRNSFGCFGQSVLLGRRRAFSHVARVHTETFTVSKTALESLFASQATSARRALRMVLYDQWSQDRLHSLVQMFRIGNMPHGRERAALLIQFAWHRYCNALAMRTDPLYLHIAAPADAGNTREMMLLILQRLERLETAHRSQQQANAALSSNGTEIKKLVLEMHSQRYVTEGEGFPTLTSRSAPPPELPRGLPPEPPRG